MNPRSFDRKELDLDRRAVPFSWMMVLMLGLCSLGARAQLAPTPPMGWNSWNHFNTTVSDAIIRQQAQAIVSSGMQAVGYSYIIIDDGWQGTRDANGNIQSNSKFPDMAGLAHYIHGLGLKIGIYSSPGPTSCAGYVGSYGHEIQDAQTFASWHIDYLKYDWCSAAGNPQATFLKMYNALQATGQTITYSIDRYGMNKVWSWGASVGANLWRTGEDVKDVYYEMAEIGFGQEGLELFAGPGHWNDPDMLQIGNGGMSENEYQTQMSLWCILSAPLVASNDIKAMTPNTLRLLSNSEVIAVDQDALGIPGKRVWQQGPLEVWVKLLADGGKAVGVFNRTLGTTPIPLRFKLIGVTSPVDARDLWSHADLGLINDGYVVMVPVHGAALLKLK